MAIVSTCAQERFCASVLWLSPSEFSNDHWFELFEVERGVFPADRWAISRTQPRRMLPVSLKAVTVKEP
ncbi:MAG: hypothetical protein KC800_31855, partial [Candidatus Eremiobacteraeota bacterium]|nr:hypothetical protein [Candidatus Eremiobacteraeota bacterium]